MTAALLFDACAGPGHPRRLDVSSATVDGTSFHIIAADGRTLHSEDLVGAVIGVRFHGSDRRVRIDSVRPDPADPALLLHAISIEQPDGKWNPLCGVAPDGSRAAFPVSGRGLPDGTLASGGAGDVEIVCTSGGQGKCLRLGYHPWAKQRDGSAMLPAFNACVRMMRADYAGSGTSETRDGTLIYVFDELGVRPREPNQVLEFEAGWDEHGAVCVRHPRIRALASLDQIAASSPRLKGHVGRSCTREAARALGALIYNSSRV